MISREVDIVKYLLESKEEANISKIAKALKMDYKNSHGIIMRLEKKGIIALKEFGKSIRVTLKDSFHPIIFEAENKRREELLKDKNLKVLLEYFDRNMKNSFYVMLLFGSYSKGMGSKGSDIDLMFIVPNGCEGSMEKDIQGIASMIPMKLHINIFSEKDFISMKNSKEATVGSEAIKNNVILHGIEQYYGLVS
jgi:predicted transcriptional regulator